MTAHVQTCVPVGCVYLWQVCACGGVERGVPIDGIYVCVPPPREGCVLMCENVCLPVGYLQVWLWGNENYVNVEECGCESVWGFEG